MASLRLWPDPERPGTDAWLAGRPDGASSEAEDDGSLWLEPRWVTGVKQEDGFLAVSLSNGKVLQVRDASESLFALLLGL